MPQLVFEEPYRFIAPHRSSVWPSLVSPWMVPIYRRFFTPIRELSFHGTDQLRESLSAGHGMIMAANHSRTTDPFVTLCVGRHVGAHPFGMGSWHAFKTSRVLRLIGPPLGAFSVFREGIDHESIKCAVDLVASAKRPLILFPEGGLSHANDLVGDLLDGTAFIARAAASRRAKETPPGKVVIHPIAIRYTFLGDVPSAVLPSLREFERRFEVHPPGGASLHERICALGETVVRLNECEYLGSVRTGSLYDRLDALIEAVLVPLEQHWGINRGNDSVRIRINKLRAKILVALLAATEEAERQRCRHDLQRVNVAQQFSIYPRGHLAPDSPPEHFLETIECLEEGLNDRVRNYGPFSVHVRVGPAIPVDDARRPRQGPDPLMQALTDSLRAEVKAAWKSPS